MFTGKVNFTSEKCHLSCVIFCRIILIGASFGCGISSATSIKMGRCMFLSQNSERQCRHELIFWSLTFVDAVLCICLLSQTHWCSRCIDFSSIHPSILHNYINKGKQTKTKHCSVYKFSLTFRKYKEYVKNEV